MQKTASHTFKLFTELRRAYKCSRAPRCENRRELFVRGIPNVPARERLAAILKSLRFFGILAACLPIAAAVVAAAPRDEPPVIPIGFDAYRMWDRWPYQRIGARAYMRSTYDRAGGNEGADASHFLFQSAPDFNVTLDIAGAGVLYFARLQPLAWQPLGLRRG